MQSDRQWLGPSLWWWDHGIYLDGESAVIMVNPQLLKDAAELLQQQQAEVETLLPHDLRERAKIMIDLLLKAAEGNTIEYPAKDDTHV